MGRTTLPLTAAGTALLKQNVLAHKVLLKAEAEWRAKHPTDNTDTTADTTASTTADSSDSSDTTGTATAAVAAVDDVTTDLQQAECIVA
eukprot:3488-Heterococcus_DN1.PRE.2